MNLLVDSVGSCRVTFFFVEVHSCFLCWYFFGSTLVIMSEFVT